LYDEQINSVEGKIDQMMKLTDTKIMSIPGIADILGPTIVFFQTNFKFKQGILSPNLNISFQDFQMT